MSIFKKKLKSFQKMFTFTYENIPSTIELEEQINENKQQKIEEKKENKRSTFTFENIPSAMDLKEQINAFEQQKIEEQENKYKMYADQYKKIIKKAACACINDMLNKCKKSAILRLSMDNNLCKDGLTFRQVHHNINYDTDMPYTPLFENLFKDIQIELFKKGYYLLQDYYEYDDDEGYCLILYIGKPDGYDEEPVKYKGFNKIPEH